MISIILIAYNEEYYIEKTLKSLSEINRINNAEIIVVYGGSSDNTVKIASKYAKIISSEKGKSKQLNSGAKIARGDILFFIHADMIIPKNALDLIMQRIIDGYDAGGFENSFSTHNKKLSCLAE